MAVDPKHQLLLYVEDEKSVRTPVAEMLKHAGFDILLANNGVEALNCIATDDGHIDCVVTDVRLGRGSTGWNIGRRARLHASTMPIVYTSSSTAAEWMAYGVPMSELVIKPFRPAQLIDALSSVAARVRAAIPPVVRRTSKPVALDSAISLKTGSRQISEETI
ncbi:response regulator [Sphingobium sp. AR-3-1]|uniref:Response regulator n=1 Tax=Sphingobium psychrophilum TaxID=2728834 RepID=A0A7X9ZUN4_9SPHN|nr:MULTISPECIES: response regulator [Sphingobium]NML11469.1 response regulator [Sphingobium psychrophilum]